MQADIPPQEAGVVNMVTTLLRLLLCCLYFGDGPFAKRYSISHVVMSLSFDFLDRVFRHERSTGLLGSNLDGLLLD